MTVVDDREPHPITSGEVSLPQALRDRDGHRLLEDLVLRETRLLQASTSRSTTAYARSRTFAR
jgi:hypothetical protein